MRHPIVFCALLLALSACTAIQQQKAQPPRPDDLHFHNLQILPQNIARKDLVDIMKGYTRALGVRCQHCHVRTAETPKEIFDFPSDANPKKNDARVMMRMTERINTQYVAKINDAHTTVSCWTCHRGHTQPDIQPSVPAVAPVGGGR